MLSTLDHGGGVDKEGHGETPDNGSGHNATKVLNDGGQAEDASDMEDNRESKGQIPRWQGITEIRQLDTTHFLAHDGTSQKRFVYIPCHPSKKEEEDRSRQGQA